METRSFTTINVSFWMQFVLLFKKSFICSIRDQVIFYLMIFKMRFPFFSISNLDINSPANFSTYYRWTFSRNALLR
jgi:hypothetical protein